MSAKGQRCLSLDPTGMYLDLAERNERPADLSSAVNRARAFRRSPVLRLVRDFWLGVGVRAAAEGRGRAGDRVRAGQAAVAGGPQAAWSRVIPLLFAVPAFGRAAAARMGGGRAATSIRSRLSVAPRAFA